jgi:hypothetical protein
MEKLKEKAMINNENELYIKSLLFGSSKMRHEEATLRWTQLHPLNILGKACIVVTNNRDLWTKQGTIRCPGAELVPNRQLSASPFTARICGDVF